jgi:hypothetical protein
MLQERAGSDEMSRALLASRETPDEPAATAPPNA